jgi:hypothetical protein
MSHSKPAVSSLKRTQTETQIEYDEQDQWFDDADGKEAATDKEESLDNREVWMLCEDEEILAEVQDYLSRNKVPKNYTGPIFIDDDIFILDVPMQ